MSSSQIVVGRDQAWRTLEISELGIVSVNYELAFIDELGILTLGIQAGYMDVGNGQI